MHPRRRDRRARRLLLLWHERPHTDRARLLARRRRGQVPDLLSRGRHPRSQPVRDARPERCRRPDAHRRRARPHDEAAAEARDLRRARRRAEIRRLLPRARPRLRELLAVSRSTGETRGGAGCARRSRLTRVRGCRRLMTTYALLVDGEKTATLASDSDVRAWL